MNILIPLKAGYHSQSSTQLMQLKIFINLFIFINLGY